MLEPHPQAPCQCMGAAHARSARLRGMVEETAAAMAVSGLVLAGGAGRRMGGSDKGLLAHRGRPLVAGVVERLAAQVDEVMIAAAALGYLSYGRLVADAWHEADGGRAGPLAGLLGGLRAARQIGRVHV